MLIWRGVVYQANRTISKRTTRLSLQEAAIKRHGRCHWVIGKNMSCSNPG
jgi:hypothetical protein